MPYRTIKTTQRMPGGIERTVTKREWYEIEKRHTVANMIGTDEISIRLANEPIAYEFNGETYTDVPSDLINKLDEALYHCNHNYADRVYAAVKATREKVSEYNTKIIIEKDGKIYMRHNNFEEYFKDLQKIQKEGTEAYNKITKEYQKALDKWEDIRKDPKRGEYEKTEAKLEYLDMEKKYKSEKGNTLKKMLEEIEKVRSEFNEHLSDFYFASGDKIDEKIVKLFNSGLKLTSAEIDGILEKNISNPTMLRLISQHCKENKIDNKKAIVYGEFASSEGRNEKGVFEAIANVIPRSVENWNPTQFEKLVKDAVEEMTKLPLKPSEE